MLKRAILQSEESQIKNINPVLIIDKFGALGMLMARELEKDFVVIYAGKEKLKKSTRIIKAHYKNNILHIPDNVFSHIFIFINSKEEIVDLLPQIIKKAKLTSSRLVVILSNKLDVDKITKKLTSLSQIYPITTFFTGDIFGYGDSSLDDLIQEAKKYGSITLKNNGLTESYPVHTTTLIDEIIRVTFQSENKVQSFLILQKFALTDLAIARIFSKIMPEIKIKFKKSKEKHLTKSTIDGIYTTENFNIEKKIKEELNITSVRVKKKIDKNNKNIYFAWLLKIVSVLIFTPFLLTLLFSLLGVVMAKSGWDDVNEGVLIMAEKKFSISKNSLSLATQTGKSVDYILGSIGFGEYSENLLVLLESGVQLSEAGEMGVASSIHYKNILTGNSKEPAVEIQQATQSLRASLTQLQKVNSKNNLPKYIKEEIEKNQKIISLGNNLADLSPEILGINKKKIYLLLFQNNMELRPGGGFIGSYGLLTINNGLISSIKINDVYDADGKLKGHVEPPFALRRFAGIKHWYLRDSNFNIDFEENAKKAMYFLELETGDKVDGVIALDTEILISLLKLYGPLDLPGYNKKITFENVVMETQIESQDNFFPGSTQKKDFLNSLKNELEKRIKQNNNVSYDLIVRSFVSLINEKHIMFVLKNEASQKILRSSNLSGALIIQKNNQGILNDFIYLNEANIGGTKGNMYIKKDMIHSIKLNKEKIEEEVKIRYRNTSLTTSKYGGEYIGYIQLALPLGSTIKNISINDQDKTILSAITDPEIYESEKFVPRDGLEILTENTNNASIFSYPILIPANSYQTIKVNYEIPLINNNYIEYRLTNIKQPGTLNTPYLLKIYYENGKKPKETVGLHDKKDRGEFRGNLSTDYTASLHFINE